jgi:hypothetical protein
MHLHLRLKVQTLFFPRRPILTATTVGQIYLMALFVSIGLCTCCSLCSALLFYKLITHRPRQLPVRCIIMYKVKKYMSRDV